MDGKTICHLESLDFGLFWGKGKACDVHGRYLVAGGKSCGRDSALISQRKDVTGKQLLAQAIFSSLAIRWGHSPL